MEGVGYGEHSGSGERLRAPRHEAAEVTYEELYARLLPDAVGLFRTMVTAHLEAVGDRLFVLAVGGGHAELLFAGASHASWQNVDPGTLDELASYGLLRKGFGRRDPNYRLTGEGVRFYQWMLGREGTAVTQTERQMRHLIEGDEFAKAHPSAARHLDMAFQLLWSGDLSESALSELGDHLRKAIFDVVADVVPESDSVRREQPVAELVNWIAVGDIGEREQRVLTALIEFVDATLRLDHRLAHARDERDLGRPVQNWSEARRASFMTALVCYEVHTLRR
jgi:hypothetical protein